MEGEREERREWREREPGIAGRIERATRDSGWCRTLEKHGKQNQKTK